MARAEFEKGAKLERWEAALRNPNKALRQIGALMVSESQRAFKQQKFGKEKWPARGVPNVFGIISDFHQGLSKPPERRFEPRPALRDTGRLFKSIAFKVAGKSVTVGSNLPYASVHQTGGQVESLPITEQVQSLLWGWLKKQGNDLKRRLGFILNKKFTGKTLKGEVPARPFVGITKQTIEDVEEVVGVKIFEVR